MRLKPSQSMKSPVWTNPWRWSVPHVDTKALWMTDTCDYTAGYWSTMHTRSCKELQMNQFIRPQKPLSHIFKAAEIATTTTTTPVISCQQPRFLRLLCFKQWRCCAADAHENTQGNHSDSSKNMRDMHKKKKKEKMQASLRRVQVNVTAAVFFIQKASCVWCVWFSAVQTKNSSWFWTSWMFPVHVLPAAHYPPLLPSPFVRHVSCRPPRHKPCVAKVHNIRVIRQVIIMRWGWQHDGTVRRVSLSLLLSSQLSVPLPCVPAEAGAAAHHGEDGAQQQGQSVARVVRLRRGDQGEQQQADEGCCVRKFKFGSHVELFFFSRRGLLTFREAWAAPASQSDDGGTSWCAQPMAEQLYSNPPGRLPPIPLK